MIEKIAQKFLEYDFDRHGIKYGILADEILALIKKAGYVKLAEDQSLPEIPQFNYDKEMDRVLLRRGAINYSKLFTGWRKVKLEGIEK